LSSVEDSSADSPPKGYSTEAWNPPKNWVSPERIALALISAQPLDGVKVAVTLLANYFFISELLILSLLDLQNSISFSKRAPKLQDFQMLSNI